MDSCGCGPGFFTTAMARMVGQKGRVIAVDLQEEMLNKVRKKAALQKLSAAIEYHRCKKEGIGLAPDSRVDFILAYYMVHEIPDKAGFFKEAGTLLKNSGKLLVVEPRLHVGKSQFEKMVLTAEEEGFTVAARPKRKGGRSVLLTL